MTEFLNTETHTPVLLTNHLQSLRLREVRIWVNTVFILISERPKLRDLQRTKITRAPCRRRIGGVVPRAENLGDMITADHKVLSEGCESRNNHRYEVVVQDMATQWIQAYPCKTKTSLETQKSLQKFLEPNRKPKSFTLSILWNLAKPVKIFPGIIVRQHHTEQKQKESRESRAQCERRHLCCIVAIRSG